MNNSNAQSLSKLLQERHLPDLLVSDSNNTVSKENWSERRAELIEHISDEYGTIPPAPLDLKENLLSSEKSFCAGMAVLSKVMLTFKLSCGDNFSFPVYACEINDGKVHPAFILINFTNHVPDKYLPSEELCDIGFNVYSFCYDDISSDDANYNSGLAEFYCGENENKERGKLALWAWGIHRVMDYVMTRECTDNSEVAVVGHSRLGKTALLAGGLDTRIATVISNDSGCSGAAISRGKCGETIERINNFFPFWFKESYSAWAGKEYDAPYDQHYLLSLTAPRRLYVASAALDSWADPDSELLSLYSVQAVYKLLGCADTDFPERTLQENEVYFGKKTGCHKRSGSHYLSRYDWQKFCEFILKNQAEKK